MLISGGAQLKLYVYALNNRFIYKHGYIIHTNINKHDFTIHELYSHFVRTRPPAPAALGTYASKDTLKQNEN